MLQDNSSTNSISYQDFIQEVYNIQSTDNSLFGSNSVNSEKKIDINKADELMLEQIRGPISEGKWTTIKNKNSFIISTY